MRHWLVSLARPPMKSPVELTRVIYNLRDGHSMAWGHLTNGRVVMRQRKRTQWVHAKKLLQWRCHWLATSPYYSMRQASQCLSLTLEQAWKSGECKQTLVHKQENKHAYPLEKTTQKLIHKQTPHTSTKHIQSFNGAKKANKRKEELWKAQVNSIYCLHKSLKESRSHYTNCHLYRIYNAHTTKTFRMPLLTFTLPMSFVKAFAFTRFSWVI